MEKHVFIYHQGKIYKTNILLENKSLSLNQIAVATTYPGIVSLNSKWDKFTKHKWMKYTIPISNGIGVLVVENMWTPPKNTTPVSGPSTYIVKRRFDILRGMLRVL